MLQCAGMECPCTVTVVVDLGNSFYLFYGYLLVFYKKQRPQKKRLSINGTLPEMRGKLRLWQRKKT